MNPSQAWAARQHSIDMMGARDLQPAGNPTISDPHPDDYAEDTIMRNVCLRVLEISDPAARELGYQIVRRIDAAHKAGADWLEQFGHPTAEQLDAFAWDWDDTTDWKDPEARW